MAVAAIFIAQLNGVELSLSRVIEVCFTATLAAMSSGGVPSAGLALVLTSVGLPIKDASLLLLADRILIIFQSQLAIRSQSKLMGQVAVGNQAKLLSTKLENAPAMTTMPVETDGTVEMPETTTNSANAEISVEIPAAVTNPANAVIPA
ncbi:hypothetical protein KIN20_006743 [Parelaphostrongylus tenuis]|uniref:Amino acid transporter n=1 Tax=Parelaphostrongylus tenuis TaxID=148309 RepID=A0AAD5QG70_PARTN|nr:hypothetical protein KIN20_006743 [Parelaphostrongylus tenuis]